MTRLPSPTSAASAMWRCLTKPRVLGPHRCRPCHGRRSGVAILMVVATLMVMTVLVTEILTANFTDLVIEILTANFTDLVTEIPGCRSFEWPSRRAVPVAPSTSPA